MRISHKLPSMCTESRTIDLSHEPRLQVTNGVSCVFPRRVTICVYFVTYCFTNNGCESRTMDASHERCIMCIPSWSHNLCILRDILCHELWMWVTRARDCGATHEKHDSLHKRHDLRIYETWLIHMRDMTHYTSIVRDMTAGYPWETWLMTWEIWLLHMCDMTHSYFKDMTLSHVRHDLFICQRPDWGVYSKRGRQVCIASTCLLVNFREASL